MVVSEVTGMEGKLCCACCGVGGGYSGFVPGLVLGVSCAGEGASWFRLEVGEGVLAGPSLGCLLEVLEIIVIRFGSLKHINN